MAAGYDQQSEMLAESSELHGAASISGADPLSDVLRTVKLKGALFFLVDATSPWCVEVPQAADFAGIILPSSRHVVSYHVVVEGRGLANVHGCEPVAFDTGDIIVFPHGDGYCMAGNPGVAPELDYEQTLRFFRDAAAGELPFVIPEGGGNHPHAKFICGFLGCDLSPFNPLLGTLPRMLHIRPSGNRATLLDRLVDLALAEIRTPRLGGDSIRLGLSELMFVESLRRYLETLPSGSPGWLQGLRDPIIGRALALLHAEPAKGWNLETLARAAGTSRSVLAERFGRHVGETPMRYLTRWRMQLAARLLADGGAKVAAIAERVGFGSEAAFSRTFKKATGVSPAEWRRTAQASGRARIAPRRRA